MRKRLSSVGLSVSPEEKSHNKELITFHTQVNSIETQLRDMKHTKLHARVADLEDPRLISQRQLPDRPSCSHRVLTLVAFLHKRQRYAC